MSLLVIVVTLNGRSRDFVDPQLLNLHLSPELPESGSAELRKEVQQVVAAGWRAKMNVEVIAHAIQIFLLFWRFCLQLLLNHGQKRRVPNSSALNPLTRDLGEDCCHFRL